MDIKKAILYYDLKITKRDEGSRGLPKIETEHKTFGDIEKLTVRSLEGTRIKEVEFEYRNINGKIIAR